MNSKGRSDLLKDAQLTLAGAKIVPQGFSLSSNYPSESKGEDFL